MTDTSARRRLVTITAVAIPLAAAGVVAIPAVTQAGEIRAHATLRAPDGSAVGNVDFTVSRNKTYVSAHLKLPGVAGRNAFHGFHIHANDKPENGSGCVADPARPPSTWFASADGHLAETKQTHGAHTGDMPSVLVNADGTTELRFTTQRLHLSDLKGRAVILHAGADNFGNVPVGTAADQYRPNSPAAQEKTAATGNAGDRLACGLVTVQHS